MRAFNWNAPWGKENSLTPDEQIAVQGAVNRKHELGQQSLSGRHDLYTIEELSLLMPFEHRQSVWNKMLQEPMRDPQVEETIIKVGGHNLSCLEKSGSGPCILAIHGIGLYKEIFDGIWPAIAETNYQVLIPDMLGFGASDRADTVANPDEVYSVEYQAALIYEALGSRIDAGVHLLAHSVGGAVAVVLAEKLGSDLKSFSNLEGNLIPEDCGMVTRGTANTNRKLFVETQFQERFGKSAGSALAFHCLAKSVVQCCEQGFGPESNSLLETFKGLPVPKFYFNGGYSEASKQVHSLIDATDGVEFVEIPKSGHEFMRENADDFYAELMTKVLRR